MKTNSLLSILLVEDHLLFSEGLKTFLQNTHKFSKVEQAHNGLIAVQMAQESKPDIVLMDIQMPEMDGLRAATLIRQSNPMSKIIMLTSFTEPECVKNALSAGAQGYCSKDIEPSRLLSVIEMISSGSLYLDPKVADFVLKYYFRKANPDQTTDAATPAVQPPTDSHPPNVVETTKEQPEGYAQEPLPHVSQYPLTGHVLKGRELEILALIANNLNHDEIAESLKISVDWVNSYIKSILQKLSVVDEWSAVKKAIGDGALKKAIPKTV